MQFKALSAPPGNRKNIERKLFPRGASNEKLSAFAFLCMSNLFMSYLHIPEVDDAIVAGRLHLKAPTIDGRENLCKSLLIANLFKLG